MLLEALLESARKYPHKPAAHDPSRHFTYAQLVTFAQVIRREVLKKTQCERVGLMLPASGACLGTVFGILWAGKTVVPLNFLLQPREVAYMVADAGLDLLISTEYFKGIIFEDPDWDFRAFDVDRDTRYSETRIGGAVNGSDPNLKPFKDRGGKLILYQAWNETIIPPRTLMDYYREIEGAMGGADQTRDFVRLFMVPGSRGCPGFGNAEDFDTLKAVEQWVEKGVAPEKIIYSHRDRGKVYRTRPVCAYPNVAIYRGSGDPNDAANFSCGTPDW